MKVFFLATQCLKNSHLEILVDFSFNNCTNLPFKPFFQKKFTLYHNWSWVIWSKLNYSLKVSCLIYSVYNSDFGSHLLIIA